MSGVLRISYSTIYMKKKRENIIAMLYKTSFTLWSVLFATILGKLVHIFQLATSTCSY